MPARVLRESRRGCGYRKAGGTYIMGGGPGRPCCRFPIPLKECPTCGHGIKPSRGWNWMHPALMLEHALPAIGKGTCVGCPLLHPDELAYKTEPIGKIGLIWIGEKFYPTPGHFLREMQEMGLSRRVNGVPKGFVPGKTLLALAHRLCEFDCPDCEGNGVRNNEKDRPVCKTCKGLGDIYDRGIFAICRPTHVEKVVTAETSEEEIQALERRGIQPVIIERADDPQLLET